MPNINRVSNNPNRWKIDETRQGRVANREKILPKSYISADGVGITPAARRYQAPLIPGAERQGVAPDPVAASAAQYSTLASPLATTVTGDCFAQAAAWARPEQGAEP